MSFKDLQFHFGKLRADVQSQIAKNYPLYRQETKLLTLWILQERNDLASMRTLAYEKSETVKALKDWIKEQADDKDTAGSRDLQDIIGDKLCSLLEKQIALDKVYNTQYQLYRQIIKSIREQELKLLEKREKRKTLYARLTHLTSTSPKAPELLKEFQKLTESLETDEIDLAGFKRFALKEAFYTRFNALFEYAEKTRTIARFGKHLIDLLDIEPTVKTRVPYQKEPEAEKIFRDAIESIQEWEPSIEAIRPTLIRSKPLGFQPKPRDCSSDIEGKVPEIPHPYVTPSDSSNSETSSPDRSSECYQDRSPPPYSSPCPSPLSQPLTLPSLSSSHLSSSHSNSRPSNSSQPVYHPQDSSSPLKYFQLYQHVMNGKYHQPHIRNEQRYDPIPSAPSYSKLQ